MTLAPGDVILTGTPEGIVNVNAGDEVVCEIDGLGRLVNTIGSDADFGDVVEAATIPVLVDMWAPWCGPCRMVSPVLEQLAGEFAGSLKLVKVNADEAPGLSQRFEVLAIPTLILFARGKVVDTQVGAAPAAVLRKWVTEKLGLKT